MCCLVHKCFRQLRLLVQVEVGQEAAIPLFNSIVLDNETIEVYHAIKGSPLMIRAQGALSGFRVVEGVVF